MIPLLVLLLAGVAWGETVCTDKTVGGKWVSSSCTSNGIEPLIVYQMDRAYVPAITDTLQLTAEDGYGSSTLELKGRELVQPINRFPYAIPEDKPTYVVMHGTTTATRIMVERIGARVEARVPCGNDDETCSDLAEALNQVRRRRVK